MADDKEKTKDTNQYTGYGTVRPMKKMDDAAELENKEKRLKK